MAIINGIFGKTRRREGEYIDLGEETGGKEEIEPTMYVKVAELQNYDNLKDFTEHVYGGNILLLDLSPVSSDDMELERITNELKRVTNDIGGDIAGLGRNLLILTPSGIKIDRRKIRGSF
ncbi:MAG: cell division protein SepF [Candidatus Thermoplasmatota archaeon]|nr:cell division protein SepF [Candidatus Thermoplasmatota archaeon]